jgi:hypothetical protein
MKYKPTSEHMHFLLGFVLGAATHEPITVMVGL